MTQVPGSAWSGNDGAVTSEREAGVAVPEYCCRFCGAYLLDPQELDWRLCVGCHDDGMAEQEAQQ